MRIAQGRGLATADALRHRLGLDADAKEHHLIARLDEGPTVRNSDAERQVLEIVQNVFRQRGYSEAHVDAVSWMWWEYCYRACPQVRKPEAWVAALHYAMGLVESWEITQDHAAELYDTSVGSVSANARKIMDLLDLEPYNDRFCVDLPVNALLEHLEGPMTVRRTPRTILSAFRWPWPRRCADRFTSFSWATMPCVSGRRSFSFPMSGVRLKTRCGAKASWTGFTLIGMCRSWAGERWSKPH